MLSHTEVVINRQRVNNLQMDNRTSNMDELVDRRRPASLSPTPAHKLGWFLFSLPPYLAVNVKPWFRNYFLCQ